MNNVLESGLGWVRGAMRTMLATLAMALFAASAMAQSGGQGAITGTVVDSTGAVIANATVTAENVATGIKTTRPATSGGVYNIAPLIPGTYTVTVTSKGFSNFVQQNLIVDAMSSIGLNVTMKLGSESDTVTVTAAPPDLDTTSSTLGGVIENSTYAELPLVMTGLQQRDITQFSNLLPGAQVNPGGRSSIIGGTGQRLGELYLDGVPLTTLSQQGDNRPVFNIVPLESIDQIKVVTSGFSAEYQGAGLENYNLKAGTNKYHGVIFGYFRNTIFDAWSFSTKPGAPGNMVKKLNTDPALGAVGALISVPGPKPAEHYTDVGYAVGGPVKIPFVFNGHDKLFFFTTYDKFRSRASPNPISATVPTTLMRTGNFQELLTAANGGLGNSAGVNYPIYDPTTLASCTAHSTNGPCRYQYGYGPGATSGAAGNPALNGQGVNIIPKSELSPISAYQASFLPPPSFDQTGLIQNNFFGAPPTGYDNWLYSGRIDYTISPRQTLSGVITGGNRHAVPYTASATAAIPFPYLPSTASIVGGHWADLQYTFIIRPNLVNQFKYGFMNFGGPPVKNITQNTIASLSQTGITGLPAGQASENAANTTFSGANSPTNWVGNTPTVTSVAETFTALDNVQLILGKHSINFGGQYQFLENNAATADGVSTPTPFTWSTNETAGLPANSGSTYTTNTGYSYASFLIGAVNSSSATLQPYSVLGGRFHPLAVYFQDDFKLTQKLTLNIGLRWDYIPTYNEAKDRFSFLNPTLANPITGTAGSLQFAGHYGGQGVSCGCKTPVNTFYKNFGPRVGFAYALDDKTVFRGGFGTLYSHAGGTGGAGGAATGTGQFGFNSTTSFTDQPAGPTAGPAFYLNNNPLFASPNANFGGPGAVLAPITPITAASQALGTGYYVCSGQSGNPCNGSSGTFSGVGNAIAYADPYLSDRAPEFNFFNFGMQREITKDITVTVNYVGSQSHFIAGAGNIRGLQSGQLDPKYLPLANVGGTATTLGTNFLAKAASTSNLMALATATGITLMPPYTGYTAAANLSTGANATIAHMLTWMPQYAGTTDSFGNVANANYNAFQFSVAHRASHGLTLNVNYTYSHNIDDAGTQRSGYAIPGNVILTGQSYAPNRIDRSLSVNSQPQNLSVYGVYKFPFGKGHIGGDHRLVRVLLGGWETSDIFQVSSGLPLAIVATCNANQNVGAGQCEPDINPNRSGPVRINGKWGQGVTAATLGSLAYLSGALPSTSSGIGVGGGPCLTTTGPFCNAGNAMLGDAPRVSPYGLRGPNIYRLTSAVRRQFDITDRAKFIFGVDCQNVTNHTTFGNNASNNQIGVNVDAATFGTLNFASADPRAFQFSGRLTF